MESRSKNCLVSPPVQVAHHEEVSLQLQHVAFLLVQRTGHLAKRPRALAREQLPVQHFVEVQRPVDFAVHYFKLLFPDRASRGQPRGWKSPPDLGPKTAAQVRGQRAVLWVGLPSIPAAN